MKLWVIVVAFLVTATTMAAWAQPSIQMGGGGIGGDCTNVSREIARNWFDVKRFFTDDRSIKRPRSSQFQCVSPAFVSRGVPKTVPGARGGLQCFQRDGIGACCDARMTACATLKR